MSGSPLLGICLGMQLLASEGEEFGVHKGFHIIPGKVVPLKVMDYDENVYKLPHISWNRLSVSKCHTLTNNGSSLWSNSILDNLKEGAFVYFVHSNVFIPEDTDCCLAVTEYGGSVFCSVVKQENVYGCQFHPERSDKVGLRILSNFVYEI